ncbi:MAG: fused MFS/spermidine synthase [Acidimicrobiales bacterium]
MRPWVARGLVFVSSGAVLVLEIVAGRLLAPYVGVSLESFTGIIGVVLAGIAIGAWLGGWAADRYDATKLLGPALVLGGVLVWLSLPISRALGEQFGDDSMAILVLSCASFFLPAMTLSTVPPMVVKIRLSDLGETGSVVGGLSAAGTAGALAGTFLTGFVLIAAFSNTTIVVAIGAAVVVVGLVVQLRRPSIVPNVLLLIVVVAGLATTLASSSPCDHETDYACVDIETDPANVTGRSLYLDRLRHAYVDLADPTNLDLRYIRVFAEVADSLPSGPLTTLHLGGGGFTFPRYLQSVRPGATDLVLEIDADLVDIAETELGLETGPTLRVRTGDARLTIRDLPANGYDLVAGDAFSGNSVPWHLTTKEFLTDLDRVLKPEGLYVMNVIDSGANRFARAEAATLSEVFDHVAVVLPATGIPSQRGVNQVLIASQTPLPPMDIVGTDGVLFPMPISAFIDGATSLEDDFAPVAQLMRG